MFASAMLALSAALAVVLFCHPAWAVAPLLLWLIGMTAFEWRRHRRGSRLKENYNER